jgi:hypothetical protein
VNVPSFREPYAFNRHFPCVIITLPFLIKIKPGLFSKSLFVEFDEFAVEGFGFVLVAIS